MKTPKQYEKMLKKAPDNHWSDEFIDFLRENNKVRYENHDWIVIENIKYWNKNNDWLTAFQKGIEMCPNFYTLYTGGNREEMDKREWVKKGSDRQTVKRFHIHLYKK